MAGGAAYRVPPPPAPPPPAAAQSLDEIVVTGSARARQVGLDVEAIRLPINPPPQRLEQRACVVFALG